MSKQKRIYPTYWQQWIGKFAIKCANQFHGPAVVYVEGVNKHGILVGKTLNSGVVFFGKPHQLLEYSPRLFCRLDAAWKAKEARLMLAKARVRSISGIY